MANTLKFGNGEWYGKKDTILAYNDENKNYKPLPFDFSRGSSATVVNKDGLIETVVGGEPRIDYKDDSKGALLLEPSRTNYLSYSQDFSYWTIAGSVTVTDNQIISPDGTLNASILDFTSAISSSGVYRFSGDRTGSLSRSIYLKGAVGGETIDLSDPHMGGGSNVTLTTEWQRFEYISTSEDTNSGLWLKNSVGNIIHAWGAQLEQGYATSYIPTQGSAVTRLADSCSQTTPDGVIGQTEGVFFLDVGKYESIGSISSGIIYIYNALGDKLGFAVSNTKLIRVRVNAVNEQIGGTQVENSKTAIRYTSTGIDVFYNGVKQTLTTIGNEVFSLPTSVNAIVPNQTYGIKGLQLYNTALTDQELIALTQV